MNGLRTSCRNSVIVPPCRSIRLCNPSLSGTSTEDEIMRMNGIFPKLYIAASVGLAALLAGCVAYPDPYYPGGGYAVPGPAYAVAAPPIFIGGGYGGGYRGGGWGRHWR
jgi:hypothetical protein